MRSFSLLRLELRSGTSVGVKWLRRSVVLHLSSETADENDETCLNIGWNVKIIRCKEAHYRILHMFSSPFSPCTLL